VIDNQSSEPLAGRVDLTWHPAARVIREETLGLTPARCRGISESLARILVFVDDDNVLEPNYLEESLAIAHVFPMIGAWGGNIIPEFEVAPAEELKPYLGMLALRNYDSNLWSNDPGHWQAQPCGAGLCAKREVVGRYVEELTGNRLRLQLGRRGESLASCEDSDIVLTATSIGLGFGIFTTLKLTHLIPARRVEQAYLLKLAEALAESGGLLNYARGSSELCSETHPKDWLRHLYHLICLPSLPRRFYSARRRGLKRARKQLAHIDRMTDHISPTSPVGQHRDTVTL